MHSGSHRSRKPLAQAAQAWGAVLFLESPWHGAALAAIACLSPAVAVSGLMGQIGAALTARLLSLSIPGNAHLVNGLLSGAYLGALHAFGISLLIWVLMAAFLSTLCVQALAGLLWRTGKLPVLSFPFVLACWFVLPLMTSASPFAVSASDVTASDGGLFVPWLDHFFMSLGSLLLMPTPLAGALFYAVLLLASRYLAVLALAGYGAGLLVLAGLGRGDLHPLGFNFMLTAMALGGIFTVPGRASFVTALAAAGLSAAIAALLDPMMRSWHQPLLTLPFVLASWFWFLVLAFRSATKGPALTLDHPRSPEISYEQARLAHTRGAMLESIPLAAPFFGEWRVSQGFNGRHTHRDVWRHALDFHIVVGGCSHAGDGRHASDFFCFGAPVLAPAVGQIVRARDDLPDVTPGEADLSNNWGNYLLLRLATGHCVLLGHLRQGSLAVRAGEWVGVGQTLAACGSSGRAPEPHLHLHVQVNERLGSPTRAFHLTNILVPDAHDQRRFLLNHVPPEGAHVAAAPRDPDLAGALHWPQGRAFRYRWTQAGHPAARVITLRSETSLLGQTRICSESGASAAFEATPSALGLYQRRGRRDAVLDLWMLALGLTPLSSAAGQWTDRPSIQLLPLNRAQRMLLSLLKPLGSGCDSFYTRTWDRNAGGWRQQGKHCLRVCPGVAWHAVTEAWMVPGRGVTRLRLAMFNRLYEAALECSGWVSEDNSVRWDAPAEGPAAESAASVTRPASTGPHRVAAVGNSIVNHFEMRRVS